jgi:hypothetical protein
LICGSLLTAIPRLLFKICYLPIPSDLVWMLAKPEGVEKTGLGFAFCHHPGISALTFNAVFPYGR